MNPCERATIVTAIACSIFNSCSKEEVAVIAADLIQLSDTLASMLIQTKAVDIAVNPSEPIRSIII